MITKPRSTCMGLGSELPLGREEGMPKLKKKNETGRGRRGAQQWIQIPSKKRREKRSSLGSGVCKSRWPGEQYKRRSQPLDRAESRTKTY
jgi:hypothetical protein